VTDHWIQRPPNTPPAVPTVERTDGNTLPYAGAVVLYYPQSADPVYAAIAQVAGFANLPAGLPNLTKLLADTHPTGTPYFELAESLAGAGQLQKAALFYQQAVDIEPRNWRYLLGLAQTRKDNVATLERAVALAPYETSLRNGLGVAYALAGRTDDALRTLREAVFRNPEDSTTHHNLGRTLMQTGDLRSAVAEFREAVRVRPEMIELRMNFADALMQSGQFREAKSQIEEAIRVGPSTVEARNTWSASMAAAGNVEEARAQYGLSLRRQAAGLYNNLGTVCIALQDTEAAIRAYRTAVDEDPQSAAATLNLGLTLAGQDQADEARRWLERSLQLKPDELAAHLRLGALLLAAGSRSDAIAHLRRAAESPEPRIRSEAQKLLDGVR
jgi:Flp pilus assembly protein TadD